MSDMKNKLLACLSLASSCRTCAMVPAEMRRWCAWFWVRVWRRASGHAVTFSLKRRAGQLSTALGLSTLEQPWSPPARSSHPDRLGISGRCTIIARSSRRKRCWITPTKASVACCPVMHPSWKRQCLVCAIMHPMVDQPFPWVSVPRLFFFLGVLQPPVSGDLHRSAQRPGHDNECGDAGCVKSVWPG